MARLFTKLGFVAFGGLAAHLAMMRQEVVEQRHWMDDQEFLDLNGATNFIPGPNSTELAIHIGRERAGWLGLLVAGTCFIVPATLIVLAFAVAYGLYGTTPAGRSLLYGITPVVVAIVAQALWGLLKTAVKGPLTAVVGAGALERPDERQGRKYLFGSRERGYAEPLRTAPRLGFFDGFVDRAPIPLRRDDAAREPSLPAHPLQRLGQRLAAEALLLPREFAYGKVRLLLAGARLAEGYASYLHYRLMEAGALRLASNLALSRLPRRLAQEDLRPTTPRWPP